MTADEYMDAIKRLEEARAACVVPRIWVGSTVLSVSKIGNLEIYRGHDVSPPTIIGRSDVFALVSAIDKLFPKEAADGMALAEGGAQ